jgi:hypothetical protein
MSDMYHAVKDEWEPLDDERVRLGNHIPDGYVLNVPSQDIERLASNLNREADSLVDLSQGKWTEIKALLFEILTRQSSMALKASICPLEDKIRDLAMINRQIGSVQEQLSRMPGYWKEEDDA